MNMAINYAPILRWLNYSQDMNLPRCIFQLKYFIAILLRRRRRGFQFAICRRAEKPLNGINLLKININKLMKKRKRTTKGSSTIGDPLKCPRIPQLTSYPPTLSSSSS